jgi:hypothetical protein
VRKNQSKLSRRLVAGKPFNPFKLFRAVFIPLFLFEDKSISMSAAVLYGWLLYHAGSDGLCNPSQRRLGGLLRLDERSIRRLLRALEDLQYIRHVRGWEGHSNSYEFLWKPRFSPFLRKEFQTETSGSDRQYSRPIPDSAVRSNRASSSDRRGQESPSKRRDSKEIQKEIDRQNVRSRRDSHRVGSNRRASRESTSIRKTAERNFQSKNFLSSKGSNATSKRSKRTPTIRSEVASSGSARSIDRSASKPSRPSVGWPDERSKDPDVAAVQDLLNKKCGERLGCPDEQITKRILAAANGQPVARILKVLSTYPADSATNRTPSGRGKPKPKPNSYAFFVTHVERSLGRGTTEYRGGSPRRQAARRKNDKKESKKERVYRAF